jgi:phosphoglycerate kinase
VIAKEKGVQLLLPSDVVVADKFDPNANTKIVDIKCACCRACRCA